MLESHGASRILASFHDIVPHWIFAGLYFFDDYISSHPGNIQKVLNGLVESFSYIHDHETEARKLLPKYTKVEEDLCMIAALREYAPMEPLERIQVQKQLMVDYGFIKDSAPIETMIDYRFIPKRLKTIGQADKEGKL